MDSIHQYRNGWATLCVPALLMRVSLWQKQRFNNTGGQGGQRMMLTLRISLKIY